MKRESWRHWARRGVLLLVPAWLASLAPAAQAVPAYARQTGSDCVACHIAGVGPHLTPHGIWFKLNGYTEGEGKSLPLSAQVRLSHNETHLPTTKDGDRLDEVSVYLAGRLAPHVGAYVKATHTNDPFNTGADRNNALGPVDVRFADTAQVFGREALWGVTVNNAPGVTDPLDANQIWGFPTIATAGSLFNPTTAPAMAERVLGLTAYTLIDSQWYAELGGYRSLSRAAQHHLGHDPQADPGKFSGVAPYWRLAYLRDFKTQFIGAGLYGMSVKRQLALLNPSPRTTARLGPNDKLRDIGADLMYEYLGNREHIVQLRANYVRERVDFGSTPTNPFTGAVAPANSTLRERTLAATYVFRQTYGATFAWISSRGSADTVRNYPFSTADSKVRYMEVFWTPFGKEDSWQAPWANLRIAANWVRFDKFNGGTQQIFGPFSPNSRDLNTFQLYAQVSL